MIKRARIVKRNDIAKQDFDNDLLIGADFHGLFKKGIIYEIIDYGLGEYIIKEIGPCYDEETNKPGLNQKQTIWNNTVSEIITEYFSHILMTAKEVKLTNDDD